MLLMTPDAELDCKICEIIIDIMKERIKVRKSCRIRVRAGSTIYNILLIFKYNRIGCQSSDFKRYLQFTDYRIGLTQIVLLLEVC